MCRDAMVKKPNPRVIDYRIEPASISKIIARGLGSNFPNELSDGAQFFLDLISQRVAKMEKIFNNALCDVQIVFHHPDNMKTSGFAFEPEIDGLIGQTMTNVDCWGAQEEKTLHGSRWQSLGQHKISESDRPSRLCIEIIEVRRTCHGVCHFIWIAGGNGQVNDGLKLGIGIQATDRWQTSMTTWSL
ncbi:hypothetical protein AUP68_17236 [Ilyonectria robusta]